MKRWCFLALLALLTVSCLDYGEKGKLEQEIEKAIPAACDNKPECYIDLSEITTFSWTKLYVFKYTASIDTIRKIVGQDYPFTDISRHLVFIDDKKNIVYHEDVFPNVETVLNGEIVFDIPDSLDYREFENKKFLVEKVQLEEGKYYFLLSQ